MDAGIGATRRSLLIDGEGAMLGADRVFLRRTPVGYLCAGLGESSRLLRLVFDEEGEPSPASPDLRRLATALKEKGHAPVRLPGIGVPLGEHDDPYLRRLGLAAALIKGEYDPDQPRDERGRWTNEGATGAAGAATTGTAAIGETAMGEAAASLFSAIGAETLAGLAAVGAGMAAGLVQGSRGPGIPDRSSGESSFGPDGRMAFRREAGRRFLSRLCQ